MGELHETEIDGVRCFWVDSGRPTLSASLLFRVGVVDETFATHGWTHLLEHMALHQRGGGALQINGSVSTLVTSFDAHGPASDVGGHLSAVTRWLADPHTEHLQHEVDVLGAESRTRNGGGVPNALVWRYGARGPGLVAGQELGLSRATPDGLLEWAASVFTASNAVLALDGPPPSELALGLPAGDGRRPIPAAQPCKADFPGSYVDRGLIMSGITERVHDAMLLPPLLERGLRARLRDEKAASYAPWSHYEHVDKESAVVFAGADLTPAAVDDAARTGFVVVRELAQRGPDAGHLDEVVARIIQMMQDPYNAASFAWRSAHRDLQGFPVESVEDVITGIKSAQPEAIAEHATAMLRTLIIGAPSEAGLPPKCTAIIRPVAHRTSGRDFRHRNWPGDGSRLTVGDRGIQVTDGSTLVTHEFDKTVGLIEYPHGIRMLMSEEGWPFTVDPSDWQRGDDAVDVIDDQVPAELHVSALSDEVGELPKRWSFAKRWRLGFARAYSGSTGVTGEVLAVSLIFVPLFVVGVWAASATKVEILGFLPIIWLVQDISARRKRRRAATGRAT